MRRPCPKDGTLMSEIRYETEMIDQCSLCGGTWCDGNELENILLSRNHEFSTQEIKAATYLDKIPVVQLEHRNVFSCSICKFPMEKRDLPSHNGITIDVCPKGHGCWLDYGELARIQILVEAREKGRSPDDPTTYFSLVLKIASEAKIIPAKRRTRT